MTSNRPGLGRDFKQARARASPDLFEVKSNSNLVQLLVLTPGSQDGGSYHQYNSATLYMHS